MDLADNPGQHRAVVPLQPATALVGQHPNVAQVGLARNGVALALMGRDHAPDLPVVVQDRGGHARAHVVRLQDFPGGFAEHRRAVDVGDDHLTGIAKRMPARGFGFVQVAEGVDEVLAETALTFDLQTAVHRVAQLNGSAVGAAARDGGTHQLREYLAAVRARATPDRERQGRRRRGGARSPVATGRQQFGGHGAQLHIATLRDVPQHLEGHLVIQAVPLL
nr:hypothetical protein [Mycobacterium interjectum]